MRVALLSDVHANLQALEAVLRHAEGRHALDEVWSLGDIVGYGAQPEECLVRLQALTFTSVAGNHDQAAAGGMDTSLFNLDAAAATAWTAQRLSDDNRRYLLELPLTLIREDMTLVHGSLRAPLIEYIFSVEAAQTQLERQTTPYSFAGHTHVPLLVEQQPHGAPPSLWPLLDGDIVELRERRLVVNPGGVGQPRDGDPRAAYAVLDTEERTLSCHRVEYDIAATQRVMAGAGLPERLIRRISYGR